MRFIPTIVAMAGLGFPMGCVATDDETTASTLPAAVEKPSIRDSPFKSADEFDPSDVAAIHQMQDRWSAAFASGTAAPVEFMFESDAVFDFPSEPDLTHGAR